MQRNDGRDASTTDVILVNMPFGRLNQPSIALGVLQAILEQAGIGVSSVYANFAFAELIGLSRYQSIDDTVTEDLLGEWIFSPAAFSGEISSEDEYLERLVAGNASLQQVDSVELKRSLQELRSLAKRFVRSTAEQILRRGPRIVGCTSMFQQHAASLALLGQIRELAPDVVTLLGGANCETVMGRTTHAEFRWVDFVVSGEADELIVPLCQSIFSSGREIDELPPGVFAPRHRGEGYPTERGSDALPRAITQRLDTLPAPNYDDFFATLERSTLRTAIQPGLLVETSRGCWWGQKQHCTFCGLNGNGMQYRSKSAQRVLDELASQTKRYQLNGYDVVDNILDMNYFRTLFPRLQEANRPYRLFYEVKANLRREQVRSLREAGVTHIQPGIESLHSRVLSLMRKGCQAWQNIQLLKWCSEFGIWAFWNVLFDFPGEQDAWYGETADWVPTIEHLQPPNGGYVFAVRFDRFSPYHASADEFGLRLRPAWAYEHVYPLPADALENQCYYFEDDGDYGRHRSRTALPRVERPQTRRLQDLLCRWNETFWSDQRPKLEMSVEQDRVVIHDSRHCARDGEHLLEGLFRDVYLRCDDGLATADAGARLASDLGCTSMEIEAVIDSLLEDRLMIRVDDRYLSLAVRSNRLRLADPLEYPGGYVDCRDRSLVPGATVTSMTL